MADIDLNEIPTEYRDVYTEIVEMTDAFCDRHLNDEYKELCRDMAFCMCSEDSPLTRGKRASWACGIVYAVGWVNFLTDATSEPYMRSEAIAEGFGVSQATMMAKCRVLRDCLQLRPLDPDWCLPSLLDDNPLAWMVKINGVVMDARSLPLEIQRAAYAKGLIPYVPGSADHGDEHRTEDGQIIGRIEPDASP